MSREAVNPELLASTLRDNMLDVHPQGRVHSKVLLSADVDYLNQLYRYTLEGLNLQKAHLDQEVSGYMDVSPDSSVSGESNLMNLELYNYITQNTQKFTEEFKVYLSERVTKTETINIHEFVKGWNVRLLAEKREKAAIKIQAAARGYMVRQGLGGDQASPVTPETPFVRDINAWGEDVERALEEEKKAEEEQKASIVIQSALRGMVARRRVKDLREEEKRTSAAIKLQAMTRGLLARREFSNKKDAAITLQAHLRGAIERRQYNKREAAAVKIQALTRGFLDRKKAERTQENAVREAAATKIQAVTRGMIDRKKVKAMKEDKAKQQKNIDEIKNNLRKGYPKRVDREELRQELEKTSYRFEDGKFREVRFGENKNLKNALTYHLHGKNPEDLENSAHPHDDILLRASGDSIVEYDLRYGGVDEFNAGVDRAMSELGTKLHRSSHEQRAVLVKFSGAVEKPVLDENGHYVMKVVKGDDGKALIGEDGKPLMAPRTTTEVDAPFCVVHSDGPRVTKTFVSQSYVNKEIKLSDEDLEKREDELVKAALEQLKSEPDGEEKNNKVVEIVRSALREESQQRLQDAIERGKEEAKIRIDNSQDLYDALRDQNKKMINGTLKSSSSRQIMQGFESLHDAIGPDGISITKAYDAVHQKTYKKVTFRLTEDGSELNDVAYIAIPGTPLHVRAQVALADGEITYFKNGVPVTEIFKRGQVVVDENTTVYKNPTTGKYDPVAMESTGLRDKRPKSTKLENKFIGAGYAKDYLKSYKKLDVMVTSMIGNDMGVAMKRGGKRVLSATVPKAVSRVEDGSKLTVEREIPSEASFSSEPWLIASKDSEILKIPEFDIGVFDSGKREKDQKREEERQKLILKRKDQASDSIRIKVKVAKESQMDLAYDEKGNLITLNRLTNSRGESIEIRPGEVYIDDIVNKKGEKISDNIIRQTYGEKFLTQLKKSKVRSIYRDKVKEKEDKFLKAVENGDLETVKAIISDYQSKESQAVQISRSHRGTTLLKGEKLENLEAKISLSILSRSEADIFVATPYSEYSMNALHLAVSTGNEEMVKLLLEEGFNPAQRCSLRDDPKKQEGLNAFELAEYYGFKKEAHDWVKGLEDLVKKANENESPALARLKEVIRNDKSVVKSDLEERENKLRQAVELGNHEEVKKILDGYVQRKYELDKIFQEIAARNGELLSKEEMKEAYGSYNIDILSKGVDGQSIQDLANQNPEMKAIFESFLPILQQQNRAVEDIKKEFLIELTGDGGESLEPRKFIKAYYFVGEGSVEIEDSKSFGKKEIKCRAGDVVIEQNILLTLEGDALTEEKLSGEVNTGGINHSSLIAKAASSILKVEKVNPTLGSGPKVSAKGDLSGANFFKASRDGVEKIKNHDFFSAGVRKIPRSSVSAEEAQNVKSHQIGGVGR